MKNKEILAKMPVGEIVPKRVLAAMKRKGLIYDYSRWGYLESARIPYKDEDDSWHRYIALFPKGNAREADSFVGTMETRIYIAELSDGTLNVFYTQPQITEQDIKKFVEKVTKCKANDIYEEKQSNLQYYCIDGHVWIDTDEKTKRMYQRIND